VRALLPVRSVVCRCTTTTCWVCGKFSSGGTGAVWSDGHSSSAAALRYQHVLAGRDAAIAAALDELIEAASNLVESPPSAPSGTRVAQIG
jgi:hypothetical protein